MTTVSQIIVDAFRQSNLIAVGGAPTANEETEALRYLNRLVLSVFGNEAGDPLTALPVGENNVSRTAGTAWWNPTQDADWFVPKNVRLMLNLTEPTTVYLHPSPDDGSRFAIVDSSGNLATNNLTVVGNGNKIDGATSQTVSTNGTTAAWFYREDLGTWVKYAPLVTTDTFPFPEEFDDYFITLLAIRLNPSYGAAIDGQSQMIFERSKRQLQSRYTQNIVTSVDPALLRHANMTADREAWFDDYTSDRAFDRGRFG